MDGRAPERRRRPAPDPSTPSHRRPELRGRGFDSRRLYHLPSRFRVVGGSPFGRDSRVAARFGFARATGRRTGSAWGTGGTGRLPWEARTPGWTQHHDASLLALSLTSSRTATCQNTPYMPHMEDGIGDGCAGGSEAGGERHEENGLGGGRTRGRSEHEVVALRVLQVRRREREKRDRERGCGREDGERHEALVHEFGAEEREDLAPEAEDHGEKHRHRG